MSQSAQTPRCHAEQSEASRIFKWLRSRDSSAPPQNDIATQSLWRGIFPAARFSIFITAIIPLSNRLLKKPHRLRCAHSPRSNVLAMYASARRIIARLASEIFLSSLRREFFMTLRTGYLHTPNARLLITTGTNPSPSTTSPTSMKSNSVKLTSSMQSMFHLAESMPPTT